MAISVADSNSSIREALTTILRETAADAHRALSEIPKRKHRRTKAWRCSCGSHLIPPRTFRVLEEVRRRKVMSHFATAFLLKSLGYLEKERAATEPARKFLSDRHTSHEWLTMALGINDATVQRKSRLFPWFVSGGKPPRQLVLNRERSGAAEPLAAAFNSAFEGKLGELASKEPAEPETRPSHDLDEATRTPPPSAARTLSKREARKERDAAILKVWPRRKKGDIDYGRVCRALDDRKISVLESWPKETWCGNLKDETSRERTKKYIHDVIRPPKRRPMS